MIVFSLDHLVALAASRRQATAIQHGDPSPLYLSNQPGRLTQLDLFTRTVPGSRVRYSVDAHGRSRTVWKGPKNCPKSWPMLDFECNILIILTSPMGFEPLLPPHIGFQRLPGGLSRRRQIARERARCTPNMLSGALRNCGQGVLDRAGKPLDERFNEGCGLTEIFC